MGSVLVLSRSSPYPPDAHDEFVTYGFLRCLDDRGHDVDLVTYGGGDQLRTLAGRTCQTVATVEPPADRLPSGARRAARFAAGRSHVLEPFRCDRYADAVASLTRERAPDVVLAEHPATGQHFREDRVADAVDAVGARRVTNAPVVEYAAHRRRREFARSLRTRLALRLEEPRLRRREREVYDACDDTLVLGDRDHEELCDDVSCAVRRQRVALDPADYEPASVGDGRPSIAFLGSFDRYADRDAVLAFCGHVFPRVRDRHPGAELLVAGPHAPNRVRSLGARRGVEVVGEVDDAARLVRGASVVVAPQRVGDGARVRILESMARGTPVVATPTAADGVDARPGRDLFVTGDVEEFAEDVAALLASARLRRDVGERARRTVEETYGTQAVAPELVDNLGL